MEGVHDHKHAPQQQSSPSGKMSGVVQLRAHLIERGALSSSPQRRLRSVRLQTCGVGRRLAPALGVAGFPQARPLLRRDAVAARARQPLPGCQGAGDVRSPLLLLRVATAKQRSVCGGCEAWQQLVE